MSMRRWVTGKVGVMGAVAVLAAGAACGDDPVKNTEDTAVTDAGDVGTGDGLGDDVDEPDTTTTPDVEPTEDVPGDEGSDPDVVADVTPPSDVVDATDTMQFPDLAPDTTSPTVASITPTPGATGVATPFTVQVTFSEPMLNVVKQTFKVLDVNNQVLDGDVAVSADEKTATWSPKPTAKFLKASPYRVVLTGGTIKDQAGNPLVENYEATFYTEGYPDMEDYAALAAAHAPDLRSATAGAAEAQVPVRFDADGNWDASDNKAWLTTVATQLEPSVYYDVSETHTHYHIHYAFFFPWVNHPVANSAHANGMSGALVVVEKATETTEQRPIALTTYFKQAGKEETFTYVTTESGIVGTQSVGKYNLKAAYAQDDLFPEGRFQAVITADKHHLCIEHDLGAPTALLCPQPEAGHGTLKFAYTDGTADVIEKTEAGWPMTMSAIEGEPEVLGYALVSMVDSLWPRRLDEGIWKDDSYSNYSMPGRPGDGTYMPARFINPNPPIGSVASGRPIWNWRHDPSAGDSNPTLQKYGVLGMDPAYYVWLRHSSADDADTSVLTNSEANAAYKLAFLAYCFNPYAGVDHRLIDPACAPPAE